MEIASRAYEMQEGMEFEDDLDGSASLDWDSAHRTGGPVRRLVYIQDFALLVVGTAVCVVSTVMSVKSIHQQLTSGQTC